MRRLNKLNFPLKGDEILGLVGESGSGKSTIARTIIGLQKASKGKIIFNHRGTHNLLNKKDLNKNRLLIQMIFQDPYSSFNPRFQIASSIAEAFHQKHKHHPTTSELNHLLKQVGLNPQTAKKYPHELSGGQLQRAAIARAMAVSPSLLIADEPVSALDVSIQSKILNLLKKLQKQHRLSMIFISHDLSVVSYLADKIIVIKEGCIVERGNTEQIMNKPQHKYTKYLLQSSPSL